MAEDIPEPVKTEIIDVLDQVLADFFDEWSKTENPNDKQLGYAEAMIDIRNTVQTVLKSSL